MLVSRYALLVMLCCVLSGCAHRVQRAAAPVANVPPPSAGLTVCDAPDYTRCHKQKGVLPPHLLHSVDVIFPSDARRLRVGGISVVQVVVDASGHPQRVETVDSIRNRLPSDQADVGREMDESAIASVKQFRFEPATLNGQPVATQIKVMENFQLY